jgi:hypothetical protein
MLFKTEEAAEKLRKKKSCLEAWRSRGGGPDFIKMGHSVLYRDTDLEKFIEQNVRSSTSDARR